MLESIVCGNRQYCMIYSEEHSYGNCVRWVYGYSS